MYSFLGGGGGGLRKCMVCTLMKLLTFMDSPYREYSVITIFFIARAGCHPCPVFIRDPSLFTGPAEGGGGGISKIPMLMKSWPAPIVMKLI